MVLPRQQTSSNISFQERVILKNKKLTLTLGVRLIASKTILFSPSILIPEQYYKI